MRGKAPIFFFAGHGDAVSKSAKLKLIGELRENSFLDEGPRI
jgi:hypothetical protein